jgi:hypothetical protein
MYVSQYDTVGLAVRVCLGGVHGSSRVGILVQLRSLAVAGKFPACSLHDVIPLLASRYASRYRVRTVRTGHSTLDVH